MGSRIAANRAVVSGLHKGRDANPRKAHTPFRLDHLLPEILAEGCIAGSSKTVSAPVGAACERKSARMPGVHYNMAGDADGLYIVWFRLMHAFCTLPAFVAFCARSGDCQRMGVE